MTKKKKILISAVAALLLLVLLVFSAILIADICYTDNTAVSAARTAQKKYGMNVLLVSFSGSGKLQKAGEEYRLKYCFYVVGIKDGEEKILVVPSSKRQTPRFGEWPFQNTFEETVAALSAEFGLNLVRGEDGRYDEFIELIDTPSQLKTFFPKTKEVSLDVEFVVSYLYNDPRDDYMHRVCAGQSNGKLVFFTDEGASY